MGVNNILPELLLLVGDNLSLSDLVNFPSTCNRVWDVLRPRFQKLCLQDIGLLTVVQWAAIRGHAKLIELAISNGAEIDTPYSSKKTLRARGVYRDLNRTGIREPGIFGDSRLEYNSKNAKISTPLFLAVCGGHLKTVKILLDHGARTQDFGGHLTPAHAAATNGNVECMQAFVRPGFDINARGAQGRTFLHDATLGGVE